MQSRIGLSVRTSMAVLAILALVAVALGGLATVPDKAYAGDKETVWVLSGYTEKHADYSVIYQYSYNTKGLLKQEKQTQKAGAAKSTAVRTYKYSGLNLKSGAVKYDGKTSAKITYKVNGKGWVTQEKFKGESRTSTYKCSYNKKGQMKKRANEYSTMTYTYDSKGRVKALKEVVKPQGEYTMKFKYDAKGNLTKELTNGKVSVKYANTYKKGRLAKRVGTVPNNEFDPKFTVTFKYEKVSVPKSAVTMVEGQQKV
ncbi:MAG: hypothetical protein Q4C36_09510, partial [Coriobacteriia bacterium]|nr:hypothetical protein [Coriobacteriia bacterium]